VVRRQDALPLYRPSTRSFFSGPAITRSMASLTSSISPLSVELTAGARDRRIVQQVWQDQRRCIPGVRTGDPIEIEHPWPVGPCHGMDLKEISTAPLLIGPVDTTWQVRTAWAQNRAERAHRDGLSRAMMMPLACCVCNLETIHLG